MKKLILTVIAILMFSGCAPQTSSKSLVEVGGEASCVAYEVQDSSGNTIDLYDYMNESLSCATGAVQLSPDGEYLLYDYSGWLNLYDFKDEDRSLFALEDDLEGIGCLWYDSGDKVACALINQQKYEGGTKFVVVDLDGDTKEYFITADTMADFVCGASCYPGKFWFEGDELLKYEGHNIVAPGEVFEINLQ